MHVASAEIATSRFALLAMTVFVVFFWQINSVLADHQDPIAQTNVNEQSDLFEKSVGDVKNFEGQIEGGKTEAVEGLKNSGNTIFEISGKREGEVQNEISNLKNIKANDLNSAGAKAAAESGIMDEIYIDENKTLYKEHKKDMELIANGTNDLLGNLLAKLKELGIDCKQVKGAAEIEPEYHIDIKKEASQDAKYDPFTCEELRNKYYCRDELTLKCIRRGKKYSDWQHKTIRFEGSELHNTKTNWGYALKWRRKEWGWYITPNHPKRGIFGYGDNKQVDSVWRDNPVAIINDARIFIAGKLGVILEQIREDIIFPPGGRGIGNTYNVGSGRWRHVWSQYEFGYYYRDAADTCEEWSEEWNEGCRL